MLINEIIKIKQKTKKNLCFYEINEELKNFLINDLEDEKYIDYLIEITKNEKQSKYEIYIENKNKSYLKEYEIYYFEELTEQEKTKLENSKNFKGLKK